MGKTSIHSSTCKEQISKCKQDILYSFTSLWFCMQHTGNTEGYIPVSKAMSESMSFPQLKAFLVETRALLGRLSSQPTVKDPEGGGRTEKFPQKFTITVPVQIMTSGSLGLCWRTKQSQNRLFFCLAVLARIQIWHLTSGYPNSLSYYALPHPMKKILK